MKSYKDIVKEQMPKYIIELIDKHILIQWKQYPHIMHVSMVPYGRIVWDKKKRTISHRGTENIHEVSQRIKFLKVWKDLRKHINNN